MYQNYIFDLYGTLVDIETDEWQDEFWQQVASYYGRYGACYSGVEFRTRYAELVKEHELALAKKSGLASSDVEILLDDVFAALFLEKGYQPGKEDVADVGLFFRKASTKYMKLFPGAKELLERLHKAGKKVYLLSNAQRLFTENEMRDICIYDMFDGVFYSSDFGVKKPCVIFYEALFNQEKLEKDSSVMIGNDCIADIKGAHDFGIDSMYVHTKQSSPLNGPLPDNCRVLENIGDV